MSGWVKSFVFLLMSAPLFAGTVKVKKCAELDSTKESCFWNYTAPATCPANGCSQLVVYFAGADMGCSKAKSRSGRNLKQLRTYYASQGYVAVTACLYETLKATSAHSIKKQIPRVDRLLRSMDANVALRKAWNGKRLLFSGHSLGATVPVVAIARTSLDSYSHWQGTELTAACLYDGVYDLPALDKFYWENRPSCAAFRNRTLCKRYAGSKDCAYPLASSEDLNHDSIAGVAPSEFDIKHWKLIECGSEISRPKCALRGDWLPKDTLESLCRNLEGSPGHLCEMGSLPLDSHLNCPYRSRSMDLCRQWFDGLKGN